MTEQPEQSGKRDRNGLLTYVRVFVVDSEEEAETVGPASVNGCGEEDRSWARQAGGKGRFKVTITYQGLREETDKATVRVKQVIREEPIESHPSIETIKSKYGGVENEDGTITFPATLTNSSGGSGFGSAKTSTSKNPMYGAKTYGRKSAEWNRTYMRHTVPSDILDMEGKTSKQPPGAPRAPTGKIWVYGCAESEEKGNAVQVSENATLEDEKVGEAVYGILV